MRIVTSLLTCAVRGWIGVRSSRFRSVVIRPLGMNSFHWPAVLCIALLVSGCREPFACTGSIEPAIKVAVVDSMTGEPVAEGAFGTIREGTYIGIVNLNRCRPGFLDDNKHKLLSWLPVSC